MVEMVEPRQEKPLDDDAGCPYDQRRHDQRPPVVEAEIVEQHPGDEGAHHVLGAMGEVDDVEKPEDDGQAEAQDGIERAVDDSEQELPEKCLRRNSQKLEHAAPVLAWPE